MSDNCLLFDRGYLSTEDQEVFQQFSTKLMQLKEPERSVLLRILLTLDTMKRDPSYCTDWDKGYLYGCYRTASELGIFDIPSSWKEADPIHELTMFHRAALVSVVEESMLPMAFKNSKKYENEFVARHAMQVEFEETKQRFTEEGKAILFEHIASDCAFIKVEDTVYQWLIEDLV